MSIFEELSKGVVSDSPEKTMELAKSLGNAFPENHVLAISGDLGAGKTTFTKGFAESFHIDPRAVKSPSFNIYNIHEGRFQLLHMDLYRLESLEDVEALMIDEWLETPWVVVVEWPERGLPEWMEPCIVGLQLSIQSNHSVLIKLEPVPQSVILS